MRMRNAIAGSDDEKGREKNTTFSFPGRQANMLCVMMTEPSNRDRWKIKNEKTKKQQMGV